MTDRKFDLGADREQDGGTLQAVKPAPAEQDGKPGTKDTGGSSAELGGDKKQQEGLDPRTATFSSPFYDPFGDVKEDEIEMRALGEHQSTTTIDAYNSSGAQRRT